MPDIIWFIIPSMFGFAFGIIVGRTSAQASEAEYRRRKAFDAARDTALPGSDPQGIIEAAKEYEHFLYSGKGES